MSFLGTYRDAMAAQWMAPEQIRRLQISKLRRLVRRAYDDVPYYRELMDEAQVAPEDVRELADLSRIPVTTKDAMRDQPAARLVSRRADRDRLRSESSSGSTGTPFTVLYDSSFQQVRSSAFLRALRSAGYTFGSRLLLITGRRRNSALKRLLGWRYESIQDSPDDALRALHSFRPAVLYGCTSPLRLLAEQAAAEGPPSRPLEAVITTAETIDADTRGLLERTFRCPVFDFYGLTEIGLVGWECTAHRGYHVAEDMVLVERAEPSDGESSSRLIMTNLDSTAMPFIRFDSGDLGRVELDQSCSCGRSFGLLHRIEGRAADCIRLADGRAVSPYALTCRLEKIRGTRRFQVIQHDVTNFTIRVVSEQGRDEAEHEIRAAVCAVLGDHVEVTVHRHGRLDPPPGTKFRVVESMLAGSG